MASLNTIRSQFLSFFEKNDHEIVASSPLVPRNDPTLMFTNAGMVQFKNVFTGVEQRPYARAVTSQKCVRAGGKHNDLDNVGYTARHHTFFEMLGNFSFGDYFKENAIELAWNLITKEYGLPAEKLLVTVFHEDEAAADLWKKIAGLGDDRIIRIATSDNFWSMGPTGPCGPCSEIFYDHGPEIWGGPPGGPDEDGDRFIEIWNLVFMQFEQFENGDRVDLPKPSIDTGMGLERVGAVLQGKHDNYDTDLMRALIEAVARAAGTDPDGPQQAHHRVIADHLRSTSFLIADGVLPGKDGRGYVLRRILRRAVRHAHMLGVEEPILHRLAPEMTAQMGQAFPELAQAEALIVDTMRREETNFRKTLDRGLKMLADELEKLGEGAPLPGDAAFKLSDTFGFPLDLTQDVLREQDRTVDVEGFETALAAQRAESRKHWMGAGGAAEESLWFDLREAHGVTEFLGYETDQAEGVVLAVLRDGAAVEEGVEGDSVEIVCNQTPFYAESGGQAADHGVIKTADGAARVTDVKKRADGVFAHAAEIVEGALKTDAPAELIVDSDRRALIRANHSATHLVNEALRGALGAHVAQRGSAVGPDRLRFDFSHGAAMTLDELAQVESEVNHYIRQNGAVDTRLMEPDAARAAGAQALFGEKYGDEVRVVSMGVRREGDTGPAGETYSLELCGGTHVKRLGEIGAFKLLAERGVSDGVRRVEAATGAQALAIMTAREGLARKAAGVLKAPLEELPERVKALLDERKSLAAEVAELKKQLAVSGGGEGPSAKEIGGVKYLGRALTGVSGKDLRGLIDAHKQSLGSGVVALIADTGGKAAIAVGVTQDLTDRFSAVDLASAAVAAMGGKGGGGRPDMAQAGAPDAAKSDEGLAAIERLLAG